MTADPRQLANAIRALAMDAVQAANSGHPGMPMGMADAATILWTEYLKHDPADPKWPDRDRFVLSAGHGSMLIYALLHLTGYERPTIDDIRNFRKVGSPCAGHPENFMLDGVEVTTGPLGQGVAMAVGMGVAERHLNAVFGEELVDHHTWVIAGDGCLMEGINHEAAGLAGHLKLGRLNVIWDDNRITIDGATDLSTSEDIEARYRAYGWHVVSCDGHDFASIRAAYDAALADPRPSLIACRTIIGKGAPNKQGTSATHGAALGADEVAAARKQLVWDSEPFDLPADISAAWREAGKRTRSDHESWRERLAASSKAEEFLRRMRGDPPTGNAIGKRMVELGASHGKMATRKASEAVLNVLADGMPELIGGSADLTGSNNTKAKVQAPLTADDYGGRYIYYGIREFGMAAAMNGMGLHGGIIPYGGTFLIFSDYARPAIRLSALQNAHVIYVMTHDSIGLGEDGPTHQPVEQLQSLRAMPNLDVYRPCDLVETAECWALAIERRDRPALLALSRQDLPPLREGGHMLSARGAYRLRSARAPRKVILIATGSEVSLATEVAERLESEGIGADVVSMPCAERFDEQDQAWREDILPDVSNRLILRVSIEAGTTIGWERYTGLHGLRFGIDRYGASGPASDLYEKFGLTADAITPRILAKLDEYRSG